MKRTALYLAAGSFLLLVGALCGAHSSPAQSSAQSFVRTPGQSFFLDLDTAYGNSSRWSHNDLQGITALRANVKVLRLSEQTVGWVSRFSFMLQGKQATDTQEALDDSAVEVRLMTKKPKLMLLSVLTWPSKADRLSPTGKSVEEKQLQKTLGENESVSMEISWAPAGTVTIKVDGAETYQVKIPWTVKSVSASMTNGEVEVDPLEFGNLKK